MVDAKQWTTEDDRACARPWPAEAMGLEDSEHVSLCEVLDRILNKGAVVVGEVVLSVANIDLIYLGLQLIIGSVGTVRGHDASTEPNATGTLALAPGARAEAINERG